MVGFASKVEAQYLMDMVDTTKETAKGILGVYKKYDHLKIGGYIQPQYQVASDKGIKSFEGGDFGTQVRTTTTSLSPFVPTVPEGESCG